MINERQRERELKASQQNIATLTNELKAATTNIAFIRHQTTIDSRRKDKELSKLKDTLSKHSLNAIVKCQFTTTTLLESQKNIT